MHLLFDHLVVRLQVPHRVLPAAAQPGLRAIRQRDVELVEALIVAELDHIDTQAFVAGEAVPDADVGEQAVDEGQVALAVLHDLLAPGVVAFQAEQKVLAFKVVAAAQDAFDDLRHGLMLVDAKLSALAEQGQARLQSEFITGLVVRAGLTLEAGDHTVQGAQRFDRGRAEA